MIRTAYLRYVVRGQPVVLGFNINGELVCLHMNGVDFTDNGQVSYEVLEALKERGVNIQEAISLEFEKTRRDDRLHAVRSLAL